MQQTETASAGSDSGRLIPTKKMSKASIGLAAVAKKIKGSDDEGEDEED